MKSALALVVVMVLFAAPAFAGDGNVPQEALSALGLGGMQVVSDAEGMQVRGMSSNTFSGGGSIAVGQLFYAPSQGLPQFVLLSDANFSGASDENAGATVTSSATHAQGSAVLGNLGPIQGGTPLVTLYQGLFSAYAGQAANAFAGFAAATGH